MRVSALSVLLATMMVAGASAQQPVPLEPLERLPSDVLGVAAPAARVRGLPGAMPVLSRPCRTTSPADLRRRIVDVAAQEWGFFGFRLAPAADEDDNDEARGKDRAGDVREPRRWRRPPLPPEEAARVASSIAGCMFAHLKLRHGTVDAHALDTSPAITVSQCGLDNGATSRLAPFAALGIQPAQC